MYISLLGGAKKITKLQCPSIDYPGEMKKKEKTKLNFKANEILDINLFHVFEN